MRKLVTALVMVAMVAVVVSTHLWRQLQAARVQIARLQERGEGLENGHRPFATVVPAPDSAGLGEAMVGEPPQSGGPPVDAVVPTRQVANTSIGFRELMKDPEYRAAQRIMARLAIPLQFPDLAKELGLSEEEAGKLFDLLAGQQVDSTAATLGVDSTEEERQQALRARVESSRQVDGQLRDLLGTRYTQWQEYKQTMGVRQRVTQVRALLASGPEPLSDQQAQSLLVLMAGDQQRQVAEERGRGYPADARGVPEYLEQNFKVSTSRNQQMLAAAASYLSPVQIDTLRAMLDQEMNMNRAQMRVQIAAKHVEAAAGR